MLVAIEGIDGSGKGTQTALLKQALLDHGYSTESISFPRYQKTSYGQKIGDFLNGRFGQLDEVDPFLISLLYAGDRFESRNTLNDLLESCDVLLCDRYVASNLAHQAAKLPESEQQELIDWILQVEYQINQLPVANVSILLDVPSENAQQLILKKSQRDYTEKAADLHESDGSYLGRVRTQYLQLAETQPNWYVVACRTNAGEIRSKEEITNEILAFLMTQLPAR